MENSNLENQNETPKTGAEYLRQLADAARNAGFSDLPVNAFDIEAAADKIEQQAREIESLTQQSENHQKRTRDIVQSNNRLADAIMSIIGDRVEAIADGMIETVADHVRDNFDITEYEYQIHEMIDDKVPEQKDEDEQREAVESIVKEVLSGATLTIDV
tara:strand:- start:205 stop:681 length:477 start_codon:yes stop_codon:yes gene_type:complete